MTPDSSVLVSPTALVLSLLHAGGPHVPLAMARTKDDFLRRTPRVAVVERGCLGDNELRRLALRRAYRMAPHLVLVLGRDEEPTADETESFDSIFVPDRHFTRSAQKLRQLVAATQPSAQLA
ncbi:MAG TPA: hypothetical protein VIA18_09965 [Polyangia bacterium]|jgi:hypothetical protein|nr:hypothetical protein [Polyangia bacterium]HWE27333.1 hypothetical protein [Polyangia bacterium]